MHIQQNALNRKRRKNAKELHSEHIRWLSSLGEIKIEIIALLKHGNDILLKDINSLLKESLRLQKIIMKHEKKWLTPSKFLESTHILIFLLIMKRLGIKWFR
jgi:hypothetical protein